MPRKGGLQMADDQHQYVDQFQKPSLLPAAISDACHHIPRLLPVDQLYLDRQRAADRGVFHRPFYLHAVFLISICRHP